MESFEQPSSLCHECSQLFLPTRQLNTKYPYTCYVWPYLEGDNLQTPHAALRNCHLCALIGSEVHVVALGDYTFVPPLPAYPSRPGYSMEARISTIGSIRKSDLTLDLFAVSRDQSIIRINMVHAEGDAISKQSFVRNLERSTNSLTGWDICRRWLTSCDLNHSVCRALRPNHDNSHKWTPTRLICVKLNPNSIHDSVKLCDNFNNTDDHKYAALSHCWGTKPLIKLELASISDFKTGIHMNRMPRTFQEAILATRMLGLSYLWVDSLCIVQDSKQDWYKESSLMSKVYRNCYVNLAATNSKDSNGGLFVLRDPQSIIPSTLNIRCRGRPNGMYFALPKSQTTWEGTTASAPLNARAWVFQERLLAVRTLHFGSDKVYWECCQQLATEVFPGDINLFDIHKEKAWNNLKLEFNLACLNHQVKDLGRLWGVIVMKYSSGRLTEKSDILVALSGIASELGHVLGASDKYLAGIWLSRLPKMLLWNILKEGNDPESYLAPSWSWASLIGSVVHTHSFWTSGDSLIDILEAKTTPIADEYGQVSNGYLKLSGTIIKGFLHIYQENTGEKGYIMTNKDSAVHIGPPGEILSFNLEGLKSFMVSIDRGPDSLAADQVLCLLLLHQKRSRFIYGLLIEPTGIKNDQYRRIGVFELIIETDMIDAFADPINLSIAQKLNVDGLTTITII